MGSKTTDGSFASGTFTKWANPGQPNAMSGREVGGLANALPGHRDVNNARHRAEVEAFWRGPVSIADRPGLTAIELFEALASDKLTV